MRKICNLLKNSYLKNLIFFCFLREFLIISKSLLIKCFIYFETLKTGLKCVIKNTIENNSNYDQKTVNHIEGSK